MNTEGLLPHSQVLDTCLYPELYIFISLTLYIYICVFTSVCECMQYSVSYLYNTLFFLSLIMSCEGKIMACEGIIMACEGTIMARQKRVICSI